MRKSFKQMVFKTILVADTGYLPSQIFALVMMTIIICSVAIVFTMTFDLPDSVRAAMKEAETAIFLIFSVEYLARLWTMDRAFPKLPPWKARFKYMSSPLLIIDLLAILPFYLPFLPVNLLCLRAIRLLRLLSIFRMQRYTAALDSVGNVFRRKARQLAAAFFILTILMVIASLMIFDAEHDAQPDKFRNAFSGIWWTVTTVTTVGYGDIYPITMMGKILATVIAFLGIGIVAIPAGILSAGFIERFKETDAESKGEINYCPHCGKKLK